MTASRHPVVWLLREPQSNDPYEAALEAAGFTASSVPVLSFEPMNALALRESLSEPSRYGGLILTSPRAAAILADAMRRIEPSAAERWLTRPAYVVGPRTASVVASIGFVPSGEDSGSGTALADSIARFYAAELPLLFLAGERRRDELPVLLSGNGINVEELTVYRTTARTPSTPDGPVDWVVFFSPSGVESWMENGGGTEASLAAIGSTTEEALRAAGLDVAAVADEPTPAGLIRAIERGPSGR